ncbi:MAG: hypothetical protein KME04_06120 [Pleurocapsa minor GSE-CHR-MK-17-07R]|jgi:hypothetical protein|nr:hypothetical protein [Pleurocapsa minor GSE-CHR-MK 17-07R]
MRRTLIFYAALCGFIGALTLLMVVVSQTARPTEAAFMYWPVVALIPLMIPFGVVCVGLGLVLLMAWFVLGMFARAQFLKPPPLAGLFIAVAGVLSIIFGVAWGGSVLVSHGGVRAGSYVYQLGFHYPLDGENEVYLFECDSLGVVCRWRYRDSLARFFGSEPSLGSTDSGLLVNEDGRSIDIIVNSQLVRTHPVPGS